MRRHAKASSAGSTTRQATGLGGIFRGALATRPASSEAEGTGAPSYRSIALLCALALTLTFAFGASALADAPPSVSVDPAVPAYTRAHLSGDVNPNGGPSSTAWELQYSKGSEGPWSFAAAGVLEGTDPETEVEADLAGLGQNTTYFFRLIAVNQGGANQVIKSGPSFTTLEVTPPTASIDPVSSFTATTATFTGDVNPNAPEAEPATPAIEEAFNTNYRFQCTPVCPGLEGQVAADNSSHEVQGNATELLPGTEYQVSLVAKNAAPEVSAGPVSFTTPPAAPTILSGSVSNVTPTTITLNAQIRPGGDATTYHFEYVTKQQFDETGFSAAASTPESAPIGSDNTAHSVSAAIDSLSPDTHYRYRVVATNSVDETASSALAFKTSEPDSSPNPGKFPGQGFLPHNRAWEMVSPPDKHGGNVMPDFTRTRAADDGDAVGFTSLIGFGDVRGTGTEVEYMARRTSLPGTSGWSTHAITAKQQSLTVQSVSTGPRSVFEGDFSADLSRGVYRMYGALDSGSTNVASNSNLFLGTDLRNPGSDFELLSESSTPIPLSPFNMLIPYQPVLADTSTDFSHVAFESAFALTGDAFPVPFTNKLYESVEGAVRLVGRIPIAPETSCDDVNGPACNGFVTSHAGLGGKLTRYTDRTVSADGSRIIFQSPTDFAGGNVYMREDGARTVKLNVSEKTTPEPPKEDAQVWVLSSDGTRAFFTTNEGLVDGDEGGSDLYMYDATKPEGERLTLISVDEEPADSSRVQTVIGASADGRYIYFIAGGQLVAGEPLIGGGGIYLWHEGETAFIGTFADVDEAELSGLSTDWNADTVTRRSRVTEDGRHLLIRTRSDGGLKGRGGFAGYDHAGNEELYWYSADSGQLRCASCNPSGAPATASATTNVLTEQAAAGNIQRVNNAISADGRYVFFSTAERLVSEDTNGNIDAYVYDSQSEEPALLSSGQDKRPSYFLEASPDGSNAFFITTEQLSGWDVDTSYDLYDARVGGGLPEPSPPPPSCQGDACQPVSAQLNDPTPTSAAFTGSGNQASARKRASCAKGRQKIQVRGKSRCVKRDKKRAANTNRRTSR